MTFPTFERFIEENFKRLNSDLYQGIENKIYYTFEQVEAEYSKMKFKRRKEKFGWTKIIINVAVSNKTNKEMSTFLTIIFSFLIFAVIVAVCGGEDEGFDWRKRV